MTSGRGRKDVIPFPSGQCRLQLKHVSFNVLVKRAINHYKYKSGSTRTAILKYLYSVTIMTKTKCRKQCGIAIKRMLKYGYIKKCGRCRFKLTTRGRRPNFGKVKRMPKRKLSHKRKNGRGRKRVKGKRRKGKKVRCRHATKIRSHKRSNLRKKARRSVRGKVGGGGGGRTTIKKPSLKQVNQEEELMMATLRREEPLGPSPLIEETVVVTNNPSVHSSFIAEPYKETSSQAPEGTKSVEEDHPGSVVVEHPESVVQDDPSIYSKSMISVKGSKKKLGRKASKSSKGASSKTSSSSRSTVKTSRSSVSSSNASSKGGSRKSSKTKLEKSRLSLGSTSKTNRSKTSVKGLAASNSELPSKEEFGGIEIEKQRSEELYNTKISDDNKLELPGDSALTINTELTSNETETKLGKTKSSASKSKLGKRKSSLKSLKKSESKLGNRKGVKSMVRDYEEKIAAQSEASELIASKVTQPSDTSAGENLSSMGLEKTPSVLIAPEAMELDPVADRTFDQVNVESNVVNG